MSIARHHAEWLALLDVSGPFLSLKVLAGAFPQGLDAPDAAVTRELRLAYDEWLDSAFGTRGDETLHRAWVEWVLRRVLGLPDEVLRDERRLADGAGTVVSVPEYGIELRPDFAIGEPGDGGKVRMLVQIVPPGQDLEKAAVKAAWQASPATRMMTLLRGAGVRLGLLTNGEQWMLVDRPADENVTTGFASWYGRLWLDEPLTLRAFRTLLGAHRFFGVQDKDTIEALLTASADDRQEVTDQLGYQVRRAVELLVQAIDLADQNEARSLLTDVPEEQLYEAALTVMMRLVFLLFAEEQNLLLLGDDIYDRNYAVSLLLEALREAADRGGEEVLERRHDAWARLLATFRAVYGGFRHDRLTMPAYGGGLFNPDRFPFLEGRTAGTTWLDTPADPLPISNRVVLHLLEALQVLRVKIRDGAPLEARRLSFRALDIEQIGHVYEGLLDHTAVRAKEPVLGLAGTRDQEPELRLALLEREAQRGDAAFVAFLQEQTGRSASALKKAWAAPVDAFRATVLLGACGNDQALYARVVPFAGLVRDDDYDRPMVIPAGSVYVTSGTERRATGTHYTPRSLTEPIVQHTLEPLVYNGPAEGLPREQWTLRPAADLLKLTVCDMAMGSGAFLVQVCRYLSERLLEAWAAAEGSEGAEGSGVRVQGSEGAEGSGVRVQGSGVRDTGFHGAGADIDGVADVPRSDGVAAGDGSGRRDLQGQQALAQGGDLRPDEPDSARGGVGAVEYRGGLWPHTSQGVSEPPFDRARLADGGGDAASDRDPAGVSSARGDATSLESDAGDRSASPRPHSLADGQGARRGSRTLNPEPRTLITPDGFLATNPDDAIPSDPDERTVFARRLVADRCLYGVDKNPLAVEMAKLSLWLITLAKGQPFSFLDHALRSGDSLLGISDVTQLTQWTLRPDARGTTVNHVLQPLERALHRSLALRRRIRQTPVTEARIADQKRIWLDEAEDGMGLMRLAADLLVGVALEPNPLQRRVLLNDYEHRLSGLGTTFEELHAKRLTLLGAMEGRGEFDRLRREADRLLDGRRPFHWPLEFPEVFDPSLAERPIEQLLAEAQAGTLSAEGTAAGFAAVVGNPPFQGGQKITGALGVPYRDYLVERLAGGQRGSADLCAYFFLRAGGMLRRSGQAGLIATNTIAQGDTREVGLEQLAGQGFSIPRALPSRPWPGVAAVEVAHVWVRRGAWRGPFTLDEQPVAGISPFLTVPGAASGTPQRLKANEDKSFIGSYVLGMGFVLTPDEAEVLIAKDPRNREVLFPYLNGEDLNSRPDQSPSRWVINFHDWPLERAQTYPEPFRIVLEKVKPERDKLAGGDATARDRARRWWQFARQTMNLYATIAGMERVLTITIVTQYFAPEFCPTEWVFAHRLCVFPLSTWQDYALIQSNFHESWARAYSSSLETRLNYSPSDAFETFPFPEAPTRRPPLPAAGEGERDGASAWPGAGAGERGNAGAGEGGGAGAGRGVGEGRYAEPGTLDPEPWTLNPEPLNSIGEAYHEHRRQIMLTRQEGLTKTYNRFHSSSESAEDIAELRRLHVAMDHAVAAAYGWDDLDLGHGFHQTKQGLRYTISEPARRTVLDRLLALNHQRHAEEVAAGLHEKKGSGSRRQGSGAKATQASRVKKGAEQRGEQSMAQPSPQLSLDLGETEAPRPQHPTEPRTPSPEPYARLTALLRQRGSLSNGEAQEALGLGAEEVRALLRRLVDEGLAAVEGQKRGTRYVRRG
ncbi:MAG: hypothetical protein RLZZ387_2097 [Chloroflexota bacterium]